MALVHEAALGEGWKVTCSGWHVQGKKEQQGWLSHRSTILRLIGLLQNEAFVCFLWHPWHHMTGIDMTKCDIFRGSFAYAQYRTLWIWRERLKWTWGGHHLNVSTIYICLRIVFLLCLRQSVPRSFCHWDYRHGPPSLIWRPLKTFYLLFCIPVLPTNLGINTKTF